MLLTSLGEGQMIYSPASLNGLYARAPNFLNDELGSSRKGGRLLMIADRSPQPRTQAFKAAARQAVTARPPRVARATTRAVLSSRRPLAPTLATQSSTTRRVLARTFNRWQPDCSSRRRSRDFGGLSSQGQTVIFKAELHSLVGRNPPVDAAPLLRPDMHRASLFEQLIAREKP